MAKVNLSARKKSRRYALQALYQWHLSGVEVGEIDLQFRTDNDMKKVDDEYFKALLYGVTSLVNELDELYLPFVSRSLQEIDAIALTLLRMGCYELSHRLDVPYRVVINENLELAKKFGPDDCHKFVNGILDQVAKQKRQLEIPGA